MKERTLKVDLNTARNWYYSSERALKIIALMLFSREELDPEYYKNRTIFQKYN